MTEDILKPNVFSEGLKVVRIIKSCEPTKDNLMRMKELYRRFYRKYPKSPIEIRKTIYAEVVILDDNDRKFIFENEEDRNH